jgi:RNA polymerase sigma factor (sigma-70 family)
MAAGKIIISRKRCLRLDRERIQSLDAGFFVQPTKLKNDWSLTTVAFARLLSWLDEGANADGRKYLEMRRRLVAYFDRKNCPVPDELADETMNRVARRLEEVGSIETETPARYCYITARFVFFEYLRTRAKEERLRSEFSRQPGDEQENPSDEESKARMLECLEDCAEKLDPANKKLIFQYYVGQEGVKIENRRALAKALGITPNALSIRACRIREQLELCVQERIGARNETVSE